jgi:hypothetical protein
MTLCVAHVCDFGRRAAIVEGTLQAVADAAPGNRFWLSPVADHGENPKKRKKRNDAPNLHVTSKLES